ncbi:PLP-dependent aminotransferase family protein [Mycobacterium sp. PS03-16]|uniref:aminotransferase-like domain-containing protein n=1 Tax=Mycobacterium sp. PS03-16 TaxID=2559611 RepID=UPI0010742942|nr:PLP-dependent aminotransferase family protein [Mycobacterium sp. PS03-16]TFV61179.1 PLP-dependent aminotransferase family protein [Mycobacterium sp. PS03-16]
MRIHRHTVVADEIAGRIRSGALPAGTRLPTHRDLADRYGVAVATATKVYRLLADAGLVVGEPGRGTFVRDLAGYSGLEPRRRADAPRIADLSFNQPLAADQGDQLRRALRDLAGEGDLAALLMQDPPGGRTRAQAAVATHLLGHGIDVAPDRVVLTGGGQQGLDAILGAVTAPGSVVAVDSLTYPGMKLLASARRLDLAPIPVDTVGMDLDHLDWVCAHRPVTVLYCIPTLHNPLGFVLGAGARERLAAIARRRDLIVVEDAVYAFLEPTATPLQTLIPERTFYLGSLSKNLAPGLRVGYVVTPASRRGAVIRAVRAATWGTSTIAAALATRWLADGTVEELEKLRRDDATDRQRLARAALTGLDYHAHPGSYIGWLTLPEEVRADILARHLADAGILVSTADAFATTGHVPNALRLALATPDPRDLDRALRHLRALVARHLPALAPMTRAQRADVLH